MEFPKLHPHILETLERLEISEPLAFQDKTLKKIKSGASFFLLAPEGAGKTLTLVISVMQKLKCMAVEDSPRAMIFVKDKEAALAIEEAFKPFLYRTDLRLFSAFDEHLIENQKDAIYLGCDILIGTPKRLSKLFFLNGIHLDLLKMMIVEDGDFIQKGELHVEVIRLSESTKNCQYLVFAEQMIPRFERFKETFMENARLIKC